MACEELVNRYFLPLSAFAVRLLGSRSAAEDAIQATFLKIWSNADRWKSGRASVSTWLHTITHNICVDTLRKGKSHLQESLSDNLGSEDRPDDDLHASTQARQVLNALGKLPESQRTAIILCYYQGLSNRDAAQISGVSVRALESLLARGRRSLRNTLVPSQEVSN